MSLDIDQLVRHLHQVATLQQEAKETDLLPKIRAVQSWQCDRLLASHYDLWQKPKFQPAITFFINELYGPNDYSQRDQDMARVIPKMAKLLPKKAVESLESALHLNALSFELDMALTQQLADMPLNRDSYASAYKRCDNPGLRAQQIDYIELLGHELADVVKIRGVSTLIKLARKPAQLAGLLTLHEFLQEGFTAFKELGDVDAFIQPVVGRERQIMRDLFSEDCTNPLPEGL